MEYFPRSPQPHLYQSPFSRKRQDFHHHELSEFGESAKRLGEDPLFQENTPPKQNTFSVAEMSSLFPATPERDQAYCGVKRSRAESFVEPSN
jgi:hypothetical protein